MDSWRWWGHAGRAIRPPPGQDIEIRVGSYVTWGRDIAQSENYSYDEPSLDYVPALNLGFSNPQAPLNARYRSIGETIAAVFNANAAGVAPVVFRRRPELHLFSYDPRQLYFNLAFADLSQWPSLMSTPTTAGVHTPPYAVPADMVIPYGTNTPLDIYPTQAQANVQWQNFWVNDTGSVLAQSQWLATGPAADPAGYGSIKAIHSTELPECSTSIKIQDEVLGAFRDKIGNALQCQPGTFPTSPPLCGYGTYEIFPTLVALNAASYLNHVDPKLLAEQPLPLLKMEKLPPPDPDAGVVAGVLVAGRIHVEGHTDNTCGFDWEPCDVSFRYDLQFSIDPNGYFAIVPHRINLAATNGSLCNGFGVFQAGAKDEIQTLFEQTIPQQVHDIAKGRQRIPTPDHPPLCKDDGVACSSSDQCCSRDCGPSGVCVPSNTLPWSCVYNINEAGADSASYDAAQACTAARIQLKFAIQKAAADLGAAPFAAALDQIVDDKNNWRCRRPMLGEMVDECSRSKQIRGKCEFKVPAETVVPEPDEVRIGFSELDNFITAQQGTDAGIPNASDPHQFQSTIAFLLAYYAGGVPEVQNDLCTPPPEPNSSNFYNRYFATLAVGAQACKEPPPQCKLKNSPCASNANCCSSVCGTDGKCADAPKLACGCSDGDCALGDTCVAGRCKNACRTGSDCASGTCYGDVFLCASPPNGQDCRQFPGVCFPWERCDPNYGGCFERPQPDGDPD